MWYLLTAEANWKPETAIAQLEMLQLAGIVHGVGVVIHEHFNHEIRHDRKPQKFLLSEIWSYTVARRESGYEAC